MMHWPVLVSAVTVASVATVAYRVGQASPCVHARRVTEVACVSYNRTDPLPDPIAPGPLPFNVAAMLDAFLIDREDDLGVPRPNGGD